MGSLTTIQKLGYTTYSFLLNFENSFVQIKVSWRALKQFSQSAQSTQRLSIGRSALAQFYTQQRDSVYSNLNLKNYHTQEKRISLR
jgi:hypothetical protein